jgi:putative heme-binding domain-containing protein
MTDPRLALLLASVLVSGAPLRAADAPKLKVFILAGQSNMEGQAVADLDGKDYNGGKGTLLHLLNDPAKAARFKHLRTGQGGWAVRDSVWVRYRPEKGPVKAGPLTLGYTPYGGRHHFGPELQFGHVIGDHCGGQVLLIKTAWGGKSLYKDFRPPSSGGEVGAYYTKMLADIRTALADLKKDFPKYDGAGYELAGFVWYHGWNDGVDPKNAVPEYEQNLVNLIQDVRKDLKAPNLPVVIGELTGPWVDAPGAWKTLRQAQAAAAARPEFKGTVLFVETHDFVRKPEDSPNPGHGHHEFGNAETYFLVGDALGQGMRKLLTKAPPERRDGEPARPTSHTDRQLEGWTVRVDDRLLKEPNDELGKKALRFLENKLADIKIVVPADQLKQLQKVTIVLDLSHGKLTSMQYHPSAGWLKNNGYSTDLAKCVHIPRAADLPTKRNINEQPWVILHELAHAYHDQVLGFEEPRIKEAYGKYKKSGHGDRVLLFDGRRVKHYALTNPMEFFAEMTEAYFGVNDFFPFNRAELKEGEPEIYTLLKDVWEAPPTRPDPRPELGPTLQQQLLKENFANLAKAARKQGDASRGAIVFHRPDLLCTRCHTAGEDITLLGPDLAKAGKEATDADLVESVLLPSKVIKKGFETITITTKAGKSVTGLLAEERGDAVVLRDAAQPGKLLTVLTSDIDERNDKGPSLMPEGLVNVLSGRQEFLDLTRYLIEIAEHGPERARQLRPAASLVAPPLPEYERDLDHAGLIRALDDKSLKRGEAIYTRVCANCHGTREQVGSMPTSPRFAEGKFKNGSDPLHMYQTLTHGYGMMTPQTWMVPRQKYDVIHYIREAYLRPHNPASYTPVDGAYLTALPKGKSRGPKPSNIEPWVSMNYGPSLMATLEVGDKGNFAYKGIAVRLDNGPGGVSRGRHFMLFDHDTLRVVAAWSGEGCIDWTGINFDGQHQVHPHVAGNVRFANPVGPGWANPESGTFDDPRLNGRDGKPYGPLPRSWAQYRGMYHYGNQVILSYTVGTAKLLEMPAYELAAGDKVAFTRTLNVGKSPHDLLLRVAPAGAGVAVVGRGATLEREGGFTRLRIPAEATPLAVKLLLFDGDVKEYRDVIASSPPPAALEPFTRGGPPRWPEVLKTRAVVGTDTQAFAVDVLTHPVNNPWNCRLRLTGFDFYADGKRAAVCSWDGDVWLVGGLDDPAKGLTWQRIASGLFQPLGLKIVKDKVHVCCRDQIVILHDLNGDGETDFYECFNNDHQVTEHFHEFAMGLQTDAYGNFYYAKAARHALKAVVPQHGTLLKVSKDGSQTEIVATGFRAPNGVCVNPDGTFFLTDQEGFWVPKNRIDLVERGGYYGNFWGYHDVSDPSDAAMKQPLVWITNAFDRSPSELLWVTGDGWGPLKGSLLNFSYGYGKVYVVPYEKVGGQVQGGMCELPLPQFPTGVMRGRFHPDNGQLYCLGMFAWAGNQTQPGGFYRVRYTGKPVYLPIGLKATKGGVVITFSGALDPKTAGDPTNYAVQTWSLKRSEQCGSGHYDEKPAQVTAAKVSADGKTVTLEIADLKPTWSMAIKYHLRSADGATVQGCLHNTIHRLGE